MQQILYAEKYIENWFSARNKDYYSIVTKSNYNHHWKSVVDSSILFCSRVRPCFLITNIFFQVERQRKIGIINEFLRCSNEHLIRDIPPSMLSLFYSSDIELKEKLEDLRYAWYYLSWNVIRSEKGSKKFNWEKLELDEFKELINDLVRQPFEITSQDVKNLKLRLNSILFKNVNIRFKAKVNSKNDGTYLDTNNCCIYEIIRYTWAYRDHDYNL